MKLTPSRASIAIWTIVASLLVIAAIIAAYAVFFRQQPSARDTACQQSSQHAKRSNGGVDGTSITDAICQGTGQ